MGLSWLWVWSCWIEGIRRLADKNHRSCKEAITFSQQLWDHMDCRGLKESHFGLRVFYGRGW